MSKGKQTWLGDIECFKNLFFLGLYSYKEKKEFYFEISEYVDDRCALYEALTNFKGYFVTFNGVHYDNVVLNYFVKDFEKLNYLSSLDLAQSLKSFSDKVIQDDFENTKWYKWYKNPYTQIDLFLYWSKMLRLSKKISLKSLGIQLGHDEVQELPYEHTKYLSYEEIQEVKRYNLRNDQGVLKLLFEEMKEDISLRHYINTEYGLECWSMDAPKIASRLLLIDYCKKTLKPNDDYWKYIKETENIRFFRPELYIKDVLDGFDPQFELPIFKEFFNRVLKSTRNFSEKFPLVIGDTAITMSYGIGGAHSIQENQCFKSDDEYIVVTSDYSSLYPNIIINWLCIRFREVLEKYISVKEDRIEAKKTKNKQKDKLLKLILNSLSGLLDNEHSWLHYPEGALKMRIIGQLIITKTMEIVIKNGWKVISVNTDGIECIIPKKDFEKYQECLKEAEIQFDIDLEHGVYDYINYLNVNNYYGKMEGSFKRKGSFKLDFDEKGNREIPLGDSIDELVVSKSLNLYFSKNIPLEESITNPEKYNFHIYDYCKSNKISKTYSVIHDGQKVQNLNRYYFSRNAPYLFKVKHEKSTLEHVNVGEGVKLFNKYEKKSWKEYDINYAHYISKARKILNILTTNQRQLTLF